MSQADDASAMADVLREADDAAGCATSADDWYVVRRIVANGAAAAKRWREGRRRELGAPPRAIPHAIPNAPDRAALEALAAEWTTRADSLALSAESQTREAQIDLRSRALALTACAAALRALLKGGGGA